jgi:Uncharacterized protein involved in methicillin resistance
MEVRIIQDRQQWNDFVASAPCCSISQMYEWSELDPHNFGAEDIMRIGVVDEVGKLCAAMVMTVTRAPGIKQRYFYAPRGPIIHDPDSPAMTVLLNYIKAEARRRHAFMLKIEPSVPDNDLCWSSALKRRHFRANPYHMHVRNEWVLDITPDEKTLLAGMKEKWRYNIRLAGRRGIVVRKGEGQADLDAFYHLYETTSDRDKFFINKKSHYEDVMRLFGKDGHAQLFLAEYEGVPIAGIIVLIAGPWSYYMYGASSNEHREKMPNHLLQWTAIRWSKQQGCRYYNFRGIPEILEEGQEMYGIYLFKRGFGGYALHALATQDLVYRPFTYLLYRLLLDARHHLDAYRDKRLVTQAVHASRKGSKGQHAPGKTAHDTAAPPEAVSRH